MWLQSDHQRRASLGRPDSGLQREGGIRRRGLLLSALCLAACGWGAAPALEAAGAPVGSTTAAAAAAPRNSVWLVSTRGVYGYPPADGFRLRYWRYEHETRRWQPATFEAFLAEDDPSVPTCFYLHGNRINWSESNYGGWRVYRRLAAQAAEGRPFRFVIWSWPSSQIRGQLRDVREKAWRSDVQAHPLAWFLDRLDPQVPVSLVGYSYGARIITGALHLLGGGRLNGRQMAHRVHPARRPVRAVLMAAAIDNYWLAPGCRHGRALSQMEQLLITRNSADPALRWYHMLYGLFNDTQALGYAGLAGYRRLGSDTAKVAQLDVTRHVGASHDWQRYFRSSLIVAAMQSYALYE